MSARTLSRKRHDVRPAWMEKPNFIVQLLKIIFVAFCVIVMLYPLLYVILTSFATTKGIVDNPLLPTEYSLEAYRIIFSGSMVSNALRVSILITVLGTFLSVVFTTTLAYGLTRTRDVPGSKICLYLVIFTLLFSAGMIPMFLTVRALGLLNSIWSLIIPALINGFNLVVIRNFFMELPQELLESARIDGASEFRIFWSIVLPLSKAPIAVISLFYAVGYWNNFFSALLYITDSSKWPIQLILNQYVLLNSPMSNLQTNPMAAPPPTQAVQMAVVVLATLPILILYPFAQRYFTKGVLTGAIKG